MKIEIKVLILGCLLPALLVVMPIHAQAQCSKWDAAGNLMIRQTGLKEGIMLSLQQNGRVVSGTATNENAYYKGPFLSGRQHRTVQGAIDGTIDGDRLNFQVFWPGNLTGVYTAQILPSGRLDGETYDKSRPQVRQTWHSDETLKCVPVAAPVVSGPPRSTGKAKTPADVKPPRSTGKARPQAQTQAETPSKMEVPGIVVGRPIFASPMVPMGFVILTWDAGPDHPYAEVWYRVNNGDDTFLIEQGKGSRQFPVERGKYYTFILTDAGTNLSTVSVAGQ